MKQLCKKCNRSFYGRTDKLFCSTKCKSHFHGQFRKREKNVIAKIDQILHRNWKILENKFGDSDSFIRIPRLELDTHFFNWHYFTAITINSKGKTYYHIYNMRYMKFSDDGVIVLKNRSEG